jgi:hypothetical protein
MYSTTSRRSWGILGRSKMSGLLVSMVIKEFGQNRMSYINLLSRSVELKNLERLNDGTMISNHAMRLRSEIQRYGVGCPLLVTEISDYAFNYARSSHGDKFRNINDVLGSQFKGVYTQNGWFMFAGKYLAPMSSVFDVSLWLRPYLDSGSNVFPILGGKCLHKVRPIALPPSQMALFLDCNSFCESAEHFVTIIMPYVAINWDAIYAQYMSSNITDLPVTESHRFMCEMCGEMSDALHSHHRFECNSGFCMGRSCSNCVTKASDSSNKCPFCRQLIQHTIALELIQSPETKYVV